ncbi:hypothetical protein SCA6_018071 [Theobroma cacao]
MAVGINQPLTNSIEETQDIVLGSDDKVLNLIQEVAGLIDNSMKWKALGEFKKIALPPFKSSTNPNDVEL